jgi:uncharacterized lipoprotein
MDRRAVLVAGSAMCVLGLAGCAGPTEEAPASDEEEESEGRDGIY